MSRQSLDRKLLFGALTALAIVALTPSAGIAASRSGWENGLPDSPAFDAFETSPRPQPLSFAGCVRRTFLELAAIDPDSSVAFLRATAWHLCGR